jgi:hypothetical protein
LGRLAGLRSLGSVYHVGTLGDGPSQRTLIRRQPRGVTKTRRYDWRFGWCWPAATLEISDHGGHCGFIRDWQQHGFAEHWLKTGLIAVLDGVQ